MPAAVLHFGQAPSVEPVPDSGREETKARVNPAPDLSDCPLSPAACKSLNPSVPQRAEQHPERISTMSSDPSESHDLHSTDINFTDDIESSAANSP